MTSQVAATRPIAREGGRACPLARGDFRRDDRVSIGSFIRIALSPPRDALARGSETRVFFSFPCLFFFYLVVSGVPGARACIPAPVNFLDVGATDSELHFPAIGHRAKRWLFFVFLFSPKAAWDGQVKKGVEGGERWVGEAAAPRRESSKNHASSDGDVGNPAERHWFPIFPRRYAGIGRTQSSRLIKQHANSANSYILKRARQ